MARDRYQGDGYSLQVVERREARRLVRIEPSHLVWSMDPNKHYAFPEDVQGAIVRVQPPIGATEQQTRSVKESLLKDGAVSVRVQPWEREQQKQPVTTAPMGVHERPRDVVMRLAGKSPRAADLTPLMDELLTKAGVQ